MDYNVENMFDDISWEEEHKKQQNKEIKYLLAISFTILFGIIMDVNEFLLSLPETELPIVIRKILNIRLLVTDFSNVTLAIVQIQAAVGPLVIAIIALLSGVISDEYYGISVCNYYLNIKPSIFKQKRIIIGLISAIGFSVLFYILGLYNVVFSLFWISCIVIIGSIMELYSVFKGQRFIEDELKRYSNYMLLSGEVSFEDKKDTLTTYTKWWIKQCENKTTYEQNKKRFLNSIEGFLDKDPIKGILLIEEMAAYIVKSADDKQRIFLFFEEVYENIYRYVENNNCHIEHCFDLYDDCLHVLFDELYRIPFMELKKTCDWKEYAYYITRVAIYCHDEKISDQESIEKIYKQVIWFISEYVRVLSYHASNGQSLKKEKWGYRKIWQDEKIPEDCKDIYNRVMGEYQFAYFAALLKNSQGELATSYVEVYDYNPMYYEVEYSNILLVSLILCYAYYLAERESDIYISDERRKNAKEILIKFKEKKIFDSFLYSLIEYKGSLNDLYRDIYRVMDRYEEVPANGKVKTCIIDNVFKDYFLFIALIFSGVYRDDTLLKIYMKHNRSEALFKAYGGIGAENLKEKMCTIYDCFGSKLKERDLVIERGYESLLTLSAAAYKLYLLEESKKDYSIFSELNNQNCIIKGFVEYLKTHFADLMKKWTVEPKDKYAEKKIVLLNQRIPVSVVTSDFIESNVRSFERAFLSEIIEKLSQLNKLDEYKNNNDDDFEKFLIDSNTKYVVGPQYSFATFDYRKRMQRNQLFIDNDFECVNIGHGSMGMLLKSPIELFIDEIQVKTRHVELTECDYIAIDNNKYLYRADDGIELEFTKEELESYIYNDELVLTITMKVKYRVPEEKIGYVIEKQRIE
ncbi:hypothetical protein SAMN04487830_1607 [Pseudobutyrivibrio sp. OR37]|uniref:hypothetical protein n=1 Tax=Pseudobutyrivibrio sp. OR37 TaxID=1798186 RepID=UPI0008E7A2AB|nr:hypothetical protein [Pseudobutyrivibrio sp. OR37]SFI40572.1 hypothetical protein SAMN04487830_1607 [Pseudobutyrivibrio sp. OR37]